MVIVITGGSGSGKSKMAEEIAQAVCPEKKTYVATMKCYDEESRKRIQRHRKQREGKRFHTMEWPVHLEKIRIPECASGAVLLECISNLAANELYDPEGTKLQDPDQMAEHVITGIRALSAQCRHLIIVSNEVTAEGGMAGDILQYLKVMGKINCRLQELSDVFIESVFSIPVFWKTDQKLIRKEETWIWEKEDSSIYIAETEREKQQQLQDL